MLLLGKIMILQGVGHPISCLGVCYANDPKKGGYMTPAPALDLTTSLRGDFARRVHGVPMYSPGRHTKLSGCWHYCGQLAATPLSRGGGVGGGLWVYPCTVCRADPRGWGNGKDRADLASEGERTGFALVAGHVAVVHVPDRRVAVGVDAEVRAAVAPDVARDLLRVGDGRLRHGLAPVVEEERQESRVFVEARGRGGQQVLGVGAGATGRGGLLQFAQVHATNALVSLDEGREHLPK